MQLLTKNTDKIKAHGSVWLQNKKSTQQIEDGHLVQGWEKGHQHTKTRSRRGCALQNTSLPLHKEHEQPGKVTFKLGLKNHL